MPTIIDSLIVTLGLDSRDMESKSATATKSLKGVEQEGDRAEKSVKKLGSTSKETSKGVADLSHNLTAFLGVLGGTLAIKAAITDFVETNAAISRLSKNLGIGVSDISAWGQAAEQVGGTASGLQGTFDMLSKAQTELKLTGQSSLIPYMSALGISLADVSGKAKPVDQILLDLAERFGGMDRPTANNMGRMMGIDQGTMNLLLQGRKELELTILRQRESTAVTKAQAEQAEKLQRQIAQMRQRFTQLGNTLVMAAAPAIERVLSWMIKLGDWVSSHSEFVLDFLKVLAVELGIIAAAALPLNVLVVAVLALAAGIALLWQDYQVWKRGGDSLIDWSKWEPGINLAIRGVNALADALERLHKFANADNAFNRASNNAANWLDRKLGLPEKAMGETAGRSSRGNSAYIKGYFEKQGWSSAQASGIAANLMSESAGNSKSTGDGGHAFGLAQWHEDRQAAFKAWSGKDIRSASLDEQLAFVNYELTKGNEQSAGNRLRGTTNAADAGSVISRYYERPADANGEASRRGALASSYAGIPGATNGVATPSSSSNADYSRTVNVDTINVHTQATDAQGIAADMGESMDYLFTSQANSGLTP